MVIQQGDFVRFRELTDEEWETDAWADDELFAGRTFEIVEVLENYFVMYCEDLFIPYGRFHKSFFDGWDEGDFVIIKEVK